MKVRLGFVTNSSSSSFIIAQNNKCTREEVKDLLSSMKEQISEIIRNYCWDYRYGDNISEETISEFIEEMTDHLYDEGDLTLGDWTVAAREYSSENDEYDGFMYAYGHELNTENFKVECSGW